MNKKITLKRILLLMLPGILFIYPVMLFMDRYDYQAYLDAVILISFIYIAFAWMIIVANVGLFDLTIYGVQYFFKSIIGRRMESDYIDYHFNKDKTPGYVIGLIALVGLIFFIISLASYIYFKLYVE
jgi:hypothetical protein